MKGQWSTVQSDESDDDVDGVPLDAMPPPQPLSAPQAPKTPTTPKGRCVDIHNTFVEFCPYSYVHYSQAHPVYTPP